MKLAWHCCSVSPDGSVRECTAKQYTSRMFSSSLTHRLMRIPAIVLVMVVGGCGSSVPDESASLRSPQTVNASHAEKASAPHSAPDGDMKMHEKKVEGMVYGTASVDQSGAHTLASISSIPLSVAKDLYSPEARDRYRALDYWEAKDSKAPLDPVFEAIEDDDPAVRAKATAIVERYWTTEESERINRSTKRTEERSKQIDQ